MMARPCADFDDKTFLHYHYQYSDYSDNYPHIATITVITIVTLGALGEVCDHKGPHQGSQGCIALQPESAGSLLRNLN